MALGLTIVGTWSVWRYTTHDEGDWSITHNELNSSLIYFDKNRALLPITDINV